MDRSFAALLLVLSLGCQGQLGATDRTHGRLDGAAPVGDAGGARDGGGTTGEDGGAREDAGMGRPDASEPPFDAGPCASETLATSLSTTPLSGVSGGTVFAAPTAAGGVVVAVQEGSGAVMRRFAGDGTSVGTPVTVEGNGLWGFDATADTWAVIVSRGSDALYFVGVSPSGETRFEVRLLGEVDHSVTENEWFGSLLRAGRLRWTGTQWAAYYTVNRLWADGIAHYGDQLRFFDAAGAAAGTGWGWGCSHSMEVRIEHNGTTLAPVCASDCYPQKGIHVNHRSAMLYPDEGGSNCAGGYGTSLGGVVPVADGFWVTFTATDARASHDVGFVHVGNDYRPGELRWLTEDGIRDQNVRAAAHGSGLVVAWTSGGTDRIARIDASGATVEGPIDIPAGLAGSTDFFVLANGDVGWVTGAGALARLRACR